MKQVRQISPLKLFSKMKWLDGRRLLPKIEPYDRRIFLEVLYSFLPDGRRKYNRALTGRAKKNNKSRNLVLGGMHELHIPSRLGVLSRSGFPAHQR